MREGINLGFQPETLRVLLTTGADFYTVLQLNESWPAGTSLALVFDGGASWAATISGANATFNVDKAQTATIANGTGVRLVYTNGTTDQVWAIGTAVQKNG